MESNFCKIYMWYYLLFMCDFIRFHAKIHFKLMLLIDQTICRKCISYYNSEMNTFVCRLIFCAKIADYENIIQLFDNLVKKNVTQHFTGLLLVYSDFMIHLIEASEDDIFELCREVFTNNSSIITNIKCLYMQNNAKKRFFKEWYFKKMKDNTLDDDKLKELEDNFENVSSTYEAVVVNLFKLYIELWHKLRLGSYVSIDY